MGGIGARRIALWIVGALLLVVFGLPACFSLLGMGLETDGIPPRQRNVSIQSGLSIHFAEEGAEYEGAPILLVHGLPGFHSDWAELPARLAERSRRRVIAYDRIGYGYSSRADFDDPEHYTHASSARDLLQLLDALEISQAALVGWSYGGAVVQTFAAAHPERVSRIVLVGSTGPEHDGNEANNATDTLLTTGIGHTMLRWATGIPPLVRSLTRASLSRAFSGEAAIPDGWIDYTIGMLMKPGTLEAFSAEMTRHDPSALAPERIRLPALVLHGTDDRGVDYAVAEDLDQRLPNSKLVPFFEGGHMLPVTRPDRVAEEIARFLGL